MSGHAHAGEESMIWSSHPPRTFVRHYVEMVAAMFVGMAVLGPSVMGIFTLLGHANLRHYAGLRGFLMTCYMTIGMTIWMRYRKHSWAPIAEMAGAMFVPFAVLIGPFEAGAFTAGTFLGLMHVLMLPAMALVMMRRRDEYSVDHHVRSRTSRFGHDPADDASMR